MKSNGFKIWLILATCVAIIAVTSVSVMAVTHNSEKMKNNNKIFVYKTALENKYQDSFYELMDSMKNMEINLSKLAVSQSAVTQENMLIKLALQAENAETNAAELPIYTDNIAPTIKFINQVSDFCQTLIKKVNIATGLSTEDKKTLSEMHKVIITLKDNISKIYEGLKDISIADIVNKSDGYNNNDRYVGNGFSSNKEETFDYPKLIYDGPFSDSIEETQESNLTGKTYTVAQLKTKVAQILSDYGDVKVEYLATVEKKMKLFVFDVTTNTGEKYNVHITEKGGYICQMNGYMMRGDNTNDLQELSSQQCIEMAEQFCKKLNFDVKAVWISKTIEGYIYINLCPVVNNIIVYPDLIKITVDTIKGKIVGVESYAYLLNHIERTLTAPTKVDEAKKKIDSSLTIENSAIAVIPKNNKEILCYEFKCTDGANEYFIYINAQSLEEEDILRVIKGTEGYSVM